MTEAKNVHSARQRLAIGVRIADHLAEVHMDQRVSAEKTLQSRLALAQKVFSPSHRATSARCGARKPVAAGLGG
jgi:hypothetical protein